WHPPGPDECHGLVDSLALVVDRVAFDNGSSGGIRVLNGAGDERLGHTVLPEARPHANAPQRPRRKIVEVRNLSRVLDGMQLGARGDSGPADDLVVEIREYSWRPIAGTQRPH